MFNGKNLLEISGKTAMGYALNVADALWSREELKTMYIEEDGKNMEKNLKPEHFF